MNKVIGIGFGIFLLHCAAAVALGQISFTESDFRRWLAQDESKAETFLSIDVAAMRALMIIKGTGAVWDLRSIAWKKDTSTSGLSQMKVEPFPSGAPLSDSAKYQQSTDVLYAVDTIHKVKEYSFYRINTNGVWWVASISDHAGTSEEGYYTNPPQQLYAFPLQYQASWASASQYTVPVPNGIITGIDSIYYSGVVDGEGTLILPGGKSYDVLRLRVHDHYTSSLAGPGISVHADTYISWISKDNLEQAYLEIDSSNTPQQLWYVQSANSGIASKNVMPEGIRISANPVTSDRLTLSNLVEGLSDITVSDNLGRRVHVGIAQSQSGISNRLSLDLHGMPNGYYVLYARGQNSTQSLPFVLMR